jgi:hypothetical protein
MMRFERMNPRKAKLARAMRIGSRTFEAQLKLEAEAEEAFERRAAFGPGVTVVNVLTGKRYTT